MSCHRDRMVHCLLNMQDKVKWSKILQERLSEQALLSQRFLRDMVVPPKVMRKAVRTLFTTPSSACSVLQCQSDIGAAWILIHISVMAWDMVEASRTL